jgi:hypothetical protein
MSEPGWIYNDLPFNDSLIPETALGFIYKISRISDGKAYIGRKLIYFKKTSVKTLYRKLKKGETGKGQKYKKKTTILVHSDWREYWGSSERLIADIELLGIDNFKREILFFCKSKGELSYTEARTQMDLRVLENLDRFYNRQIMCRINWVHVAKLGV